jgi:signal transduction histidine kinase
MQERRKAHGSGAHARPRVDDALLATICHDLKDPLSAIMMGSRYLLRDIPDAHVTDRTRRMAEAIERAAHRMDRVITDFQDLARIERDGVHLDLRPHAARAILEEAAEAAGAALEVRAVDPRVRVLCDRGRVLQVLGKLIANAVRAVSGGGSVRLGAEAAAQSVRFSVDDDGPGIEPDVVAHIDDYRWLATRRARSGTGLGIAIARGLVVAHGGELRVARAEGGGTIATFTLPAAP